LLALQQDAKELQTKVNIWKEDVKEKLQGIENQQKQCKWWRY
jgi:hypothetical protein